MDNRFTRVYEITKDKKLVDIAYQLTEKFQKCLDKNIEPELNGCEAECEFLKQEFKGFGNPLEQTPILDISNSALNDYTSLIDTK